MKKEEKFENVDVVVEIYEKPTIEIIELELEGILCSSGSGFENGGGGIW